MTTLVLQSGTYRAASLKQVWRGQVDALTAPVWRGLHAFGARLAASRMEQTAARVQAARPALAAELRRAADELSPRG